jgi:hypothetical protein
MAVYGQYETVSELGRTGTTSAWRARPHDGGWDLAFTSGPELGSDAQFAIKAFHVRRAEDAGGAEHEKFLGRVRAQKRTAEAPGAAHWAPILEAGIARDAAYYVTRYYPRTAARLAASPHPADAAELYAVAAGILQGLLELRTAAGRPHGNVKSTNVLIASADGPVEPGHIALTDPAVEQDATIAGEVEDLFNLGEVIHELVLKQRFAGQHTWPVPPTADWAALGPNGDRWLGLCNHLLSPRAAENWLRVDDIYDEIEALRPPRGRFGFGGGRRPARRGAPAVGEVASMTRGRNAGGDAPGHDRGGAVRSRRKKTWVALACAAVAVTGVAAAGYVRYTHQWRELCAAYDQWAGPLDQRLAQGAPPEVANDPYLQERLVLALAEARAADAAGLDPRRIADSDQPLPALADRPPLSVGVAWRTNRAWRAVRDVERSLAPDKWEALADVAARRADYEKRGWTRLAQYAAGLEQGARRPQSGPATAAWVDQIAALVDGRHRLARLDGARKLARERLAALAQKADAAEAVRDRVSEFETALKASAEADVLVPSALAADTLARDLTAAERGAAQFDAALPLLADAARRQRVYEFRGWAAPARHLAALIDRARPGSDLSNLPAQLAAAKRGWEQVENLWAQIEQRRRLLETTGDRLLATYRAYVATADLAGQPDLEALARKLDDVNDDPAWAAAAQKVADPEFARLDVAEFSQKSAAHRAFANRALATTADLRRWLGEIEAFAAASGTQLASATMSPDGAGTGPVTTVPQPPAPATQETASAAGTPSPAATQTAPTPPTPAPPSPATQQTEVAVGPPNRNAPATQVVAIGPPPKPPAATQQVAVAVTPPPATRETVKPTATTQNTAIASAVNPRPAAPESVKPPPESVRPSPTTVATAIESKPAPVTKPAPPAPPQKSPEEVAFEKEVAKFVSDCREVSLPAASNDVKLAWRARNDQIAAAVEKNPKLYTPALRAERVKLRDRLLQLDGAYKTAAAPVVLKPGPAPWGQPLVRAIQDAAPKWGATLKALIDLASAGDAKFDPALDTLVDADEQWRAAAARLVVDATRVSQLLDGGYGPGDRAADGTPVGTALAAVRTSDLYKNDAVQQALEPLLRPVSVVETESSGSALRLLAESGDQPLGVRLAAWSKAAAARRPGDAQPTAAAPTKESLEADMKLAAALLAAAQARPLDKPRGEAIKARLEADVRGRWEAVLDNAARDADVAAAVAMRDKITGVDAEKLAPRARYNLALHDLRAAVAASAGGADAARQLAPLAERLKRAVAALDSAQARRPQVAAVSTELARLGEAARVDFTKLGPLSDAAQRAGGGKIAWSTAGDPAGDKVTYRASLATDAGREDVTLVFHRVRPSAGGPSSWVCTGETSLGLFTDLLAAAGKWPDVRTGRLLPEYDLTRGDPRKGPRTWEWPRYGRGQSLTWARTWLSVPGFIPDRLEHYPPGIAAEFNPTQIGDPVSRERAPELNPSRRQPMQYVTPAAATLAASIAGCRLPTVAEWQAAYKSVEQHMGVNLRDRAWRLELEHLAARPAFRGARPDAGMFAPDREEPTDKVWANPTGGELNDGILWFREAPAAPQVFVDLVGNVAEFVTDDAGRAHVIGGSALSPPTRPLDKAFPVGADQASGGFSDVGFRLAFSEPTAGTDKLKEAVAGNWYLTK